jgi:hypothetical protein
MKKTFLFLSALTLSLPSFANYTCTVQEILVDPVHKEKVATHMDKEIEVKQATDCQQFAESISLKQNNIKFKYHNHWMINDSWPLGTSGVVDQDRNLASEMNDFDDSIE